MTAIVYCPKCGMENSDDAKECTYCQSDLQYASDKTNETNSNSVNWLLIGFLAGLIPGLLLLGLGNPGWVLGLLGVPGIPGGIIGAAIGNALGKKKEIIVVVITAIMGAFLGSCLMFVMIGGALA